ncbi:MAG: IS607 family transposase [Chloracidobacterium sp.]|nr:IS607 family transposase [Chloracidobacterium sp.]
MPNPLRYKISEAARLLGMSVWSLRRWVYSGKAPSIKTQTGRVFIPASWVEQEAGFSSSPIKLRCAIYAREPSSENKAAMALQVEALMEYAKAKGWQVVSITKDFASGLNDQRPKLSRLLKEKDFDIFLVENKNRLTRFGFRWFELLCSFKIEVVNLADNATNDLEEDLIAILTSFADRLYGQRRGRKKSKAAIKALQEN